MLPHQLLQHLITKSELVDAVLETFLLKIVAHADTTVTSDRQISRLREIYNLLYPKDFILTKKVERDLLGSLSGRRQLALMIVGRFEVFRIAIFAIPPNCQLLNHRVTLRSKHLFHLVIFDG